MIVRLIIIALLIWLGFRIYNLIQKKPTGSHTKTITKDMVCCEKCAIHVPVNEAIKIGDNYYCCDDHIPKNE
jgi:uncharacterized protein